MVYSLCGFIDHEEELDLFRITIESAVNFLACKVSSSIYDSVFPQCFFLTSKIWWLEFFYLTDYGVEADPKGSLQQFWAVIEVMLGMNCSIDQLIMNETQILIHLIFFIYLYI